MAMVLSAIIGSLVLALSGCSDQSGKTEKTLRVGVITYSQDDPFINALTDELKAHLKTMESEERGIIVSIKSGNDDQQEQNEKVEEMIDAGCDVPVSYTHLVMGLLLYHRFKLALEKTAVYNAEATVEGTVDRLNADLLDIRQIFNGANYNVVQQFEMCIRDRC